MVVEFEAEELPAPFVMHVRADLAHDRIKGNTRVCGVSHEALGHVWPRIIV